ncbi:unnamed protein product [Ixodes hexagonus]
MTFKVLMVPLLLFLNCDICSARSGPYSRDGLRRRRFRIEAAPLAQTKENVTECESLQLAKIYTHCSLPLYTDLLGEANNLQAPKFCSPVDAFNLCLENGLKETHCSNVTNLLGPTLKFFTSSVLNPYAKRCNLSSDFNGAGTAISTNQTSLKTNQTLTEERPSSQGNLVHNGTPESDHDKLPIPLQGLGDARGQAAVSEKPDASQGPKSEGSGLTDAPKKLSANDLSLDEILPQKSDKKNSSPADNLPKQSAQPRLAETGSAEARSGESTTKTGPLSADTTKVNTTKAMGLIQDPQERLRIQGNANCTPCIDVNYTFPTSCDTSNLLRRMFTCGVSMHHFILMKQDVCTCFMGYKKCVMQAKNELGCGNTSESNDPILATVKLLEGLLMSWYQNPCATYGDANRARVLSDGCNSTHAAISSVVCYATYFAMSELKTPAPWTGASDSCSAVNDVNRCLISAEKKTNCTNLRFTTHSRLFLKVITSEKQQECPLETGFINNEPSDPFPNVQCQRSKALKRALKCALSFQDLADVERNFQPPSPVPCGHVSRLHTCLEDSVEGTGCYGDISIHSEIKVYKKILEDAYDAHCLVDGQMHSGMSPRAKGKQYLMRSHANKVSHCIRSLLSSKQFRGGLGYRSWRKDLGLYENAGDENSGYYYDDSSDDHKPVFAGPRIIAMHPDDTEDDFEYEKLNSDALYQKARPDQKRVAGWRPLTDRQQGKPAADGNGSATSNDSSSPQLLLQFMRPNEESRPLVPGAGHLPETQLMMAGSNEKDEKRPNRKNEDDYFFGNDVENSELAMFPNGLDMFRHFRGGAIMNMESVVENNMSEYNGIGITFWATFVILCVCSNWACALYVRRLVEFLVLIIVSRFSDLNTYRGCLAAVLKSYKCDHGESISNIFEVYRKKIRLPYCASSADICHFSLQLTLIGFLTTLMAKHF